MKVYLLVSEQELGYKHNIAIVTDESIKNKFTQLNRFNKFEEFDLDEEKTMALINKGSSSEPWTESWRKKQ